MPFRFVSRFFLLLAPVFFFPLPLAYGGWVLYGGSGISLSGENAGSLDSPSGFAAEGGVQYEWGRLYSLKVHSGASLGVYRLHWEELQALYDWTLYTGGLHVGASTPLFNHRRFGLHLGGNLHSKWIPLFFMEDREQKLRVEKTNNGGFTEWEGYLKQNLGPVSLKFFYSHSFQPLLSQGGFRASSLGMALAWPLAGKDHGNL